MSRCACPLKTALLPRVLLLLPCPAGVMQEGTLLRL